MKKSKATRASSKPNAAVQDADLKQAKGGFWGGSWSDGGLEHEIAHPTQQSSGGGYWGGYDDFGLW